MRKALAIAAASARDQLHNWRALLATSTFLALILFVYSQLWQVIASERAWTIPPLLMVWYVAITEIVVMAPAGITQAFDRDVRAGNVAHLLVRPFGFFRQRFSECLGQSTARACAIALSGITIASVITQSFPVTWAQLLCILICSLLGVLLVVLHLFTIGVTAIWLEESTPLSWLYQKLLFIFGGMMIPLQFYPDWLKDLALGTPFAAMIYGPASLLFDPSIERFSNVVANLAFWIALSAAAAIAVALASLKRLLKDG